MVSIICKSSRLSREYAGSSSVFCRSKLQSRKRGCVATQMDPSSTSSEILFHRLPSKSKRPSIRKQIASSLSWQLIVSLFLRNSHLQRDIQQTCFCQYFCELLENSCSASKKRSENFQKVHKKHPWRSLILVKLQAFTEAATEGVPKKSVLRKVFAEFTGKHLCQGLYFNKVTGLRL